MRQLSSDLTWLMKYGFSSIWIGGFGLGTMMMFVNPEAFTNPVEEIESTKWFFLMGLAAGASMLYFLMIRLKKVSIDGDEFVVSNFRDEIRIHISDVYKVTGSLFCQPELVWLHLNKRSEFGEKIQFMAPNRMFSMGLTRHPLVAELNEMLESRGLG